MAQKTGMRGVLCALLLALLAVCGYVGAGREQTHTVSAAATRVALPEQTQDDALDAAERYRAQRSEEIALLEGVLAREDVDAETRDNAAAQLAQIAGRMETEAQCEACLGAMGINGAKAVSGAQLLTLLIPYDEISDEADKTRILDAVCGISGLDAGSIKIILTKK